MAGRGEATGSWAGLGHLWAPALPLGGRGGSPAGTRQGESMPGVQASRKSSQPRGPRCLFLHDIPLLQPHLTDAAGPAFPHTSVPPCTVLGLCPPCTLKHTHADPRTHSYTCILTHAHSHAPSPEVLLARRTPPLHSWGWTSQTRLTWGLTAGLRRREGVSVGLRLCTLLTSRVGGT